MKILVCGSRKWTDKWTIAHWMSTTMSRSLTRELVHGDAVGADRLAHEVANELFYDEIYLYPAQWAEHGRSAGPRRNALMLEKHPDVDRALAFLTKGDPCRGTWDMIHRAIACGIPVTIIEKKMVDLPPPS